jgi:F-type H+-transporting ATPase subunit c
VEFRFLNNNPNGSIDGLTTCSTKEETMKTYNKVLLALATVFMAAPALAQDAAASAANSSVGGSLGLVGLGVGIMMGLAVLGGTLGQSKAAAQALDGIARNPAASGKFTVPLILSLALIESLVLFAFLIGFSLQGAIVNMFKTVFHLPG